MLVHGLLICLMVILTSAAPDTKVRIDIDINVNKGSASDGNDGPDLNGQYDGTKILCDAMNGECVGDSEACNPWQAMRIYNESLPNIGMKYCDKCPGPACCAPSGQVFTVDIENALFFIFDNTVIYSANSSGRRLIYYDEPHAREYLVEFLRVVLIYLRRPYHIQYHTWNFIDSVYYAIKNDTTFMAQDLQRKLIDIQQYGEANDGYLSAWQPSVSCHNINKAACYDNAWLASCGTWNMFHTMTVTAYNDDSPDHFEVIDSIKGFMTYYFSCGDCRTHFANMYNQTLLKYPGRVTSNGKAMLWLWCIHNAVNQDWTGDNSSTRYWPPHPDFPLKEVCPECWTGGPEQNPTNCATLFCDPNDVEGDDKCFTASGDPDKKPTRIVYDNFSESATIDYLNRTYFGPYNKLNTKQEWNEYIFDEDKLCPNRRK